MTSDDTITLQPHGLHSPTYTLKVAAAFSEAVRVLNYASGEYRDVAIPYPNLIYSVLGHLAGGVDSLPLLFRQLGDQLTALLDAGRLEVRYGLHVGDPTAAVAATQEQLVMAAMAAGALFEALRRVHNITSAIGMPADAFDDEAG